MKVTKGTLRRRFRRLRKEQELALEDNKFNKIAQVFLQQSFKEWVRNHQNNLIVHYKDMTDDFTDEAAELLGLN